MSIAGEGVEKFRFWSIEKKLLYRGRRVLPLRPRGAHGEAQVLCLRRLGVADTASAGQPSRLKEHEGHCQACRHAGGD